MISILIVEDRPEKLKNIVNAVQSVPGVVQEGIFAAECAQTARRLMSERRFDLLILDMHLPPRLGDEARMDGGLELLQSLREGGRFKPPFHIVALTAFEEAERLSRSEMELQLWSTLVYEENGGGWRDRLRAKIRYLIDSKRSLVEEASSESLVRLAVVTALGEEFDAVIAAMHEVSERQFPGDPTSYFEGVFREGEKAISVVVATSNRMGMAAAATLTTKILSKYRPKYIAMAGIAAGIPGKVSLGDVLIADPSWDWGGGKFEVVNGIGKFSADPEQLRIDAKLRALLIRASSDANTLFQIRKNYPGPQVTYDLRAHVGGVASGAAVIGDGVVVESIREQKRKMIGVEMEVYGVMVAADNSADPRPLAFSAKSVSDFADTDKDDSNRHYATYTSAAFIRDFALSYLLDDLS